MRIRIITIIIKKKPNKQKPLLNLTTLIKSLKTCLHVGVMDIGETDLNTIQCVANVNKEPKKPTMPRRRRCRRPSETIYNKSPKLAQRQRCRHKNRGNSKQYFLT